jgi:elongation factor Ts
VATTHARQRPRDAHRRDQPAVPVGGRRAGGPVAKEKDIFVAQVAQDPKAAGKPADIVAKMVDGKIRKFLGEITLLGQPFVKDDKQSVEQVLKKAGAKVVRFVRYEVGAGIEKKQENFAEEVAAAVRGA